MKYLSAYCLSVLSGNSNPSAKDVTNILTSVGVEVDAEKVNAVVNSLQGKNLHEVIAAGLGKVGSMSFGGAGASNTTTAPAAADNKKGAPAAEKKTEAPKVEEQEEEVDFGSGGLFGDDF